MIDRTEPFRRLAVSEINADPITEREQFESLHGQVWDTAELTKDFEVIGFLAPFCMVKEKKSGKSGVLKFQDYPRFYFGFMVKDQHE